MYVITYMELCNRHSKRPHTHTAGMPTAQCPPEIRHGFIEARAREKHHWDAGIAGQQFFCQRLWKGMIALAVKTKTPIRWTPKQSNRQSATA